jgi:hypothetical protein
MSVLKRQEQRGPGVKFVSFDGHNPPIGYDDMLVLDWGHEQQATELVRDENGGFKPGLPKFWKPKGQKGVTTEAFGPDGKPLKPVVEQLTVVWVPGPTGKGLIDPSIEGDFGVRILVFGEWKDLTLKMIDSMEAGGRTDGMLQIGDLISAHWVAWAGSQKSYRTAFKAPTEQTVVMATKAKAKFDAWQEARQRAAEDRPSTLAAAAGAPADDPRGWSTGGAATAEPVGAATGGGLFD